MARQKYPAVKGKVYTINQFLRLSSYDPQQYIVGGKVVSFSDETGELILMGQGQSLICITRERELVIGSFVSVRLEDPTKKPLKALGVDVYTLPQKEYFKELPAIDTLSEWAVFKSYVREFFVEKGFLELETPSLVPCPGMEPELMPFSTEFQFGNLQKKLFLPTSPELHLKKALALGYSEVFELKECFRNGEVSDHHEAHFLMLEWYRSFATHLNIIDDVKNLIGYLSVKMGLENSQEVCSFTMAQVFKKYFGFQLEPKTSLEELVLLAGERGLPIDKTMTWDEVFHLLFLTFVEPKLVELGIVIISDFPPSQAALARLNKDGWADRFEVYWHGLEIANCFHELNDPQEQKERFLKDQEEQKAKYGYQLPIDKEFMNALESGMPPSAGIALGVERLFMAFKKITELRKLRLFSIQEQTRN